MLVSHSQDFLNGVCTNIIHLFKRGLFYYGVSERKRGKERGREGRREGREGRGYCIVRITCTLIFIIIFRVTMMLM